jgi:hypothetical protein
MVYVMVMCFSDACMCGIMLVQLMANFFCMHAVGAAWFVHVYASHVCV